MTFEVGELVWVLTIRQDHKQRRRRLCRITEKEIDTQTQNHYWTVLALEEDHVYSILTISQEMTHLNGLELMKRRHSL